jgi:hypothetical protein
MVKETAIIKIEKDYHGGPEFGDNYGFKFTAYTINREYDNINIRGTFAGLLFDENYNSNGIVTGKAHIEEFLYKGNYIPFKDLFYKKDISKNDRDEIFRIGGTLEEITDAKGPIVGIYTVAV